MASRFPQDDPSGLAAAIVSAEGPPPAAGDISRHLGWTAGDRARDVGRGFDGCPYAPIDESHGRLLRFEPADRSERTSAWTDCRIRIRDRYG